MDPKNLNVFYVGRSPDLPETELDSLFHEVHRRLHKPLGRIDMPRRRKGQDYGEALAKAFQFSNALFLVLGPDWQKKRWGPTLQKHVELARQRGMPVVVLLMEGADLPPKLKTSGWFNHPRTRVIQFEPQLSPDDFLREATRALEDALTSISTTGPRRNSGFEIDSGDLPVPLFNLDLEEVSKKLDARVQILDAPRMKMRSEAAANGGETGEEPAEAQFSVYHPRAALAGKWLKLLAYVHTAAARFKVDEDAAAEVGDAPEPYAPAEGEALQSIRKGTLLRIVPEMRGFRFDPLETTVKWQDDFNRAAFRMMADPKAPGFKVGAAVVGRVTFYVGPLIAAEVGISTEIRGHETDEEAALAHTTMPRRARVFPSYSHKDTAIVEALEEAYEGLGLQYLRDVKVLRGGEKWNPAILAKIDEADLFQLCWSHNAKASRYVEQEWRYALAKQRPDFFRPVYWEQPMPAPPPELGGLQFQPYKPPKP